MIVSTLDFYCNSENDLALWHLSIVWYPLETNKCQYFKRLLCPIFAVLRHIPKWIAPKYAFLICGSWDPSRPSCFHPEVNQLFFFSLFWLIRIHLDSITCLAVLIANCNILVQLSLRCKYLFFNDVHNYQNVSFSPNHMIKKSVTLQIDK